MTILYGTSSWLRRSAPPERALVWIGVSVHLPKQEGQVCTLACVDTTLAGTSWGESIR